MRWRTYLNVAMPMGLLALACAVSLPTAILAGSWMAIGVVTIGYRSLESFPSLGLGPVWRQGPLSTFVWAHHLVCWPKHVGLLLTWRGVPARRMILSRSMLDVVRRGKRRDL